MEIPRLKFRNSGKLLRNDVVHQDILSVTNKAYTFTIFPNSPFWRFGLRFSETRDFHFDRANNDRHANKNYKDLHLSVGARSSNGEWILSNRIELTQYNFGDSQLLNNRCDNYEDKNAVQFSINYDEGFGTLNVKYKSSGCEEFETKLDLHNHKYFKIFAWADNVEFDLECVVEIYDKSSKSVLVEKIETGKDEKSIHQFFLAGSFWEGKEDQTQRFTNNNIWENGYKDRYVEEVRAANTGDVIFLKSTFQQGGTGYIRIKGVGIVISNPGDGILLIVDWRIANLQIDINDLSFHRKTFESITEKEANLIFNSIGKKKLLEAGLINFIADNGDFSDDFNDDFSIEERESSKIASLICDSEEGEDHLEIDKDVNAFAKIMTSKDFTPPLAIALFGKWGSGKSFFMNKLKKQVKVLSKKNEESIYCKGVSQIHFNAWSYLDANLWASIITKIFEGLNEYITGDSEAKKFKNSIEKSLTQKLTTTKEERTVLLQQKRIVYHQLIKLKDEKKVLVNALELKIEQIKDERLVNIIAKVNETFKIEQRLGKAINENESLKVTNDQIKKIVPIEYWQDPTLAYRQAKSKYTFVKEFFKGENICKNILWVVLIAFLVFCLPIILENLLVYFGAKNFTFTIVTVPLLSFFISVFVRIKNTINRIHPIVASFWKIKQDYEKSIENALFEHTQKEKAINLAIENDKIAVEAIDDQILLVNETIAEIDFKINSALGTEALYSFIEKRSNSEDYKKHLGIVSYIRRDFEILSQLFIEHNKESEALRKKFDKPLERIILYIDDLDRCPENRVVEVLEAVNLLMAFPLFIVVVGVDPRWIKNALMTTHGLQFEKTNDNNGEKLEPANYLEKIFQVPFHLKEAGDADVRMMLRKIMRSETLKFKLPSITTNFELNKSSEIIENSEDDSQNIESFLPFMNEIIKDENDVLDDSNIESLILSEREMNFIEEFSEVIGTNPRVIKRFVNIYKIVRAHENLILKTSSDDKDYIIVIFILSLHIGLYKKIIPDIHVYFYTYSHDATFQNFIDELLSGGRSVTSATPYHKALSQFIKKSKYSDILTKMIPTDGVKHLGFIKRFSFSDVEIFKRQ